MDFESITQMHFIQKRFRTHEYSTIFKRRIGIFPISGRRRRKITSFDSLSSLWSGRSEAVQGLTVSVSICGSYNKHLKQIGEKLLECKRLGIRVLIPKYAIRKYSTHGFVYLKGENGTPRQLQERNFRAIAKSSFVLVVNPKGYIGPSTALEVGYAYAKGIPVFC